MMGIEPNLVSAGMLFVCTVFGLISFLPQIIKTIKTKKADDIAVLSWVIWVLSYTVMMVYAFVFTSDPVLFAVEGFEGGICLLTLLICLKYRSKGA
jgi:MtN3 and saliva related transmembrane protein